MKLVEVDLSVIFPICIRTSGRFNEFGLDQGYITFTLAMPMLRVVERSICAKCFPGLDFLPFLSNARLALSGLVRIMQEMAVLELPCATL